MKPAARFFRLAVIAALSLSCSDTVGLEDDRSTSGNFDCLEPVKGGKKENPLVLLCVIAVPGNPITSSAKSWVDPVTERYYFADASNSGVGVVGADAVTGVTSLGVINVSTMTWLQNVPHVLGGGRSAFDENNHIFSRVQVNAAIVANPATDNSTCALPGVKGRVVGRGCIAVFAHAQ